MKVEIVPTQNIEELKKNLAKRTTSVEKKEGKLLAETEKPEKMEKIPGIKKYTVDGEDFKGLQGRPVQEEVYAKLETQEDAVKCLLATIEGYDLRVLNSEKEWDLRQLKKYNPDIKHIREDEPLEMLDIEKSIQEIDGLEEVEIEMPENEDEIDLIYREMLTS